jgi:DNA-binding NarL/FixJ family response regulator
MARAILVDDHALFREGLKLLLASRRDISIVGEASSGTEAVSLAEQLKPELAFLDLAMPEGNGVDAVPRLLAACPGIRLICLSTVSDQRIVVQLLEMGVQGFVLKSGSFAELGSAVDQVLAGHRYLSPAIADGIFDAYVTPRAEGEAASSDPLRLLSDRERSVLRLICEDRNPKEIASLLGVSRKTVDVHKRNLMLKLGVATDLALIRLAIKRGILPEDDAGLPA